MLNQLNVTQLRNIQPNRFTIILHEQKLKWCVYESSLELLRSWVVSNWWWGCPTITILHAIINRCWNSPSPIRLNGLYNLNTAVWKSNCKLIWLLRMCCNNNWEYILAAQNKTRLRIILEEIGKTSYNDQAQLNINKSNYFLQSSVGQLSPDRKSVV